MIKLLLLLASLASAQQRTEVVNPSYAEPLYVTPVNPSGGDSGLATEATATQILERSHLGVVVSTSNSYNGALGAGASFIGTIEDVRLYQEITLNVAGAPSIASGTITFEFSPDGTNWDVAIPFTLTGPNTFVPLALRIVLPYYRIRYTNGDTPLTGLRITSTMHRTGAKHLTRFLNQGIDSREPVENVRAFIGGQAPDSQFVNLPASGQHSANSSTVPLAAHGSFTGTYFDISQYSGATVSILADSTGTLRIDNSIDGVNITITKEFSISSGMPFFVGIIPLAPYVRVRYTNGSVAQTNFKLATIAKIYSVNPLFEPLNSTVNDASVAYLVRSVIAGKNPSGDFFNVQLTSSNAISVSATDRPSEVRNRVYFSTAMAAFSVTTSSSIITEMTGGTTLYISALGLSCINTSVSANGDVRIRDGLNMRYPIIVGQSAVGSPAQTAGSSPSLLDPLRFSSNINIIAPTGTITCSLWMVGYRE